MSPRNSCASPTVRSALACVLCSFLHPGFGGRGATTTHGHAHREQGHWVIPTLAAVAAAAAAAAALHEMVISCERTRLAATMFVCVCVYEMSGVAVANVAQCIHQRTAAESIIVFCGVRARAVCLFGVRGGVATIVCRAGDVRRHRP